MMIELYRGNSLLMAVNDRNLLHYEMKQVATSQGHGLVMDKHKHFDRHQGKRVVNFGENGRAVYEDGSTEEKRDYKDMHAEQEQYQPHHPLRRGDRFGGHVDPQAEGPLSVGVDFAFPFAQHVYGIPEHATSLSLPTTTTGSAGAQPAQYKDPFRMYNLDVFEYEMHEPMALYGNIPMMLAHGVVDGETNSAGIFWFNPSETFIDISDSNLRTLKDAHSSTAPFYKTSHWISESGEVDFFMFGGTSPTDIMRQFTALVGRQQLPPLFALGYHQCRWNYRYEST
jgi:alpha 1,3-glucosidase